MITLNFNNTITERDMDMLFAQAFSTDLGFCRLFLDKAGIIADNLIIVSVDLSKEDSKLGESDITVVLETKGNRIGLLIEDKIDAIAMPEQHNRYIQRGRLGIKNGDYSDYSVFIVCPQKYYDGNDEAKKYENYVSYEEVSSFFAKTRTPENCFRCQQIDQALNKARKPASNNVDDEANAFLREYIKYQSANYPALDLSTREDRNGWWTDYRTTFGKVYINHKIQEGFVDLTFPGAADEYDRAVRIAEWAREHGIQNISAIRTKVSSMIRITVPKIDIKAGFASANKEELDTCFEAIQELTDLANVFEMGNAIK